MSGPTRPDVDDIIAFFEAQDNMDKILDANDVYERFMKDQQEGRDSSVVSAADVKCLALAFTAMDGTIRRAELEGDVEAARTCGLRRIGRMISSSTLLRTWRWKMPCGMSTGRRCIE